MSRGGLFRLPISPRSSAIFSWDAASGTPIARTGQVPSFTRAGDAGAHDSLGVSFDMAEDQPRFSVESSAFGLLLAQGEVFYWPMLALPQTLTMYVDWTELDMADNTGAVVRLGHDGSGTLADRAFEIAITGAASIQGTFKDNVGATFSASSAAHPAAGQRCEVRATLVAGGTMTVGVSLNEGTETTGTASGPSSLPSTWGAAKLYLGPTASGRTMLARRLRIFPGTLSMAQCRTRV